MKNSLLLIALLSFAVVAHAQVDITFRVDMSGLTIDPDGVHVAGDLNGWSTTANKLTDQGNGIFMATVSLDPGRDIQYKYLNGNAWGKEEAAPANCTVGSSNRIFTVPATNDTLELVPFNGCPQNVEKKHVIFRVDMSNVTPSANGVHVAGNFVGWNPGIAMMTDVGNGIYEYRADVLASILTVQYKYVNGNAWGNEESVPEGCKNGESNRFEAITADTVFAPIFVFGTCDTVESVTSLADGLSPRQFWLYTAPGAETIELHLAPELGQTTLQVMDIQGRSLFSNTVVAGSAEVDAIIGTGAWANGIYVVQVQSAAGTASRRLIIQR